MMADTQLQQGVVVDAVESWRQVEEREWPQLVYRTKSVDIMWIYFQLNQTQEASTGHLGNFGMNISLELVIQSIFVKQRAAL